MKPKLHMLSFRVFFGVWITIVLFSIMPILFIMIGSDETKDHFYNRAQKNQNYKTMSKMSIELKGKSKAEIKDIIEKAEKDTGAVMFLFDRGGHEITGKNYPEGISPLLDDISGGRLVVIKQLDKPLMGRTKAFAMSFGEKVLIHLQEDHHHEHPILFIASHFFNSFWMLLIIASIASIILVKSVIKPINKLSEASRKVADGDFSVRVDTFKRNDELGRLSEDFNIMTENLNKAKENQEEMLRNISHELRSPLTRLRLSLELARDKHSSSQNPGFNRIEKEIDRLNEMIGSILEISRVKAVAEKKKSKADLKDIISSVVSGANLEATAAGVEIDNRVDNYEIFGDPELLSSAFENIIRNGIRYAKTKVIINPIIKDEGIILNISDDGDGTPEDHLEKIFIPFHRVQSDRDRKTGGTGLGLAITKAIVESHKGNIYAFNNMDGGLTISVKLPL